jgi:hypothetical protein
MTIRWSDIKRTASLQSDTGIRVQILEWSVRKPSYNEFVTVVESSLCYAAQQLGRDAAVHKKSDENVLTHNILASLKGVGLIARFDASVNGHCDISVYHGNEYLWLGEAKIDNGPAYLYDGYLQLVHRYSTGQPRECCGGIIIYSRQARIDQRMAGWKGKLSEELNLDMEHFKDVDSCVSCCFQFFRTSEKTGQSLKIFNLPVALYHKPIR